MNMPEMDGLAFLRALRGRCSWREIPVLVLSGVTNKEAVVGAAEFGVKEYLLKDQFNLKELLTRIRRNLPANAQANGLLLRSSPYAPLWPATRTETTAIFGSIDPPRIDGCALRSEVLLTTSLLARLSAQQESQLSTPLLPRHGAHVAYAAHSSLSSFDPLLTALDMLADVTQLEAGSEPIALPQGATPLIAALPAAAVSATMLQQVAERLAPIAAAGLHVLCLTNVPTGTTLPGLRLGTYPTSPQALAAFITGDGACSVTTAP
jgi:hypothetical protein